MMENDANNNPILATYVYGVYQAEIAQGESVIKSPSPLNVLKDTYDHSCYCARSALNDRPARGLGGEHGRGVRDQRLSGPARGCYQCYEPFAFPIENWTLRGAFASLGARGAYQPKTAVSGPGRQHQRLLRHRHDVPAGPGRCAARPRRPGPRALALGFGFG
jgi:hypothetical protein